MKKSASQGLVKVVHEDLIYLVTDWPSGEITDDEVRRSSTALRRLINYRDLIAVWTTVVGKKDYFVPSSYIVVLDPSRLNAVSMASASQVRVPGMTAYAAIAYKGIQQGEGPIRVHRDERMTLKQFIHKPTVISDGVTITRNDLVQFVANKRGGAHYDDDVQKPSEKAIAALESYELAGKPALTYEMLGTGQALAESPSTNELLQKLESYQQAG